MEITDQDKIRAIEEQLKVKLESMGNGQYRYSWATSHSFDAAGNTTPLNAVWVTGTLDELIAKSDVGLPNCHQYHLTFDHIAPLTTTRAKYEIRLYDPIGETLCIDTVEIPVSSTIPPWELIYRCSDALRASYDSGFGDLVGFMMVSPKGAIACAPKAWQGEIKPLLRTQDPDIEDPNTLERQVHTETGAPNPDISQLEQNVMLCRVNLTGRHSTCILIRLLEVTECKGDTDMNSTPSEF